MKSGRLASENLLGGDNAQGAPATLPRRRGASMSIVEGMRLVGGRDANNSGALRSTVARRVMRMLRAHDRVRMKVLATHPTHAR